MNKLSQSLLLSITGAALMLTGCATTNSISPQYVAPNTYQSYDCAALNQELNRVHAYIEQTQKQQSTFSTTGVGIGVSAGRWGISPNISLGIGKSSSTQARDNKLSRLYGERDALIQSARLKKCAFASGMKVFGES
ncbi:hypothetical protein [Psychrobacter sp. I-STPA6b]|uniref:hypothetical protein n=1 Tax=Psychrobacter sp. I-STPA6b TaxID=2585718 RepID=UPI001D0C689B|nr:hypothetical protein [Psychrobacter sp. I-STPA6b]